MPLFTITDQVRTLYAEGIDDVIAQLGRPCRLVFPGTPCPNCLLDAGGGSTGYPAPDAAVPFSRPPCPVCGGTGKVAPTSRLATWTVKDVRRPDLVIGPGYVQGRRAKRVKGPATDLPDLLRADHVVVDEQATAYAPAAYRLFGRPETPGAIAPGRYFKAVLLEAEGAT